MKNKKMLLILSLSMLSGAGIASMNNNVTTKADAATEYTINLYEHNSETDPIPTDGEQFQIGTTSDYVTVNLVGTDYTYKECKTSGSITADGFYFSGKSQKKRYYTFTVPANYSLTSVNVSIFSGTADRTAFLGSTYESDDSKKIEGTVSVTETTKNTFFTQELLSDGTVLPSGTYYVNASAALGFGNITIKVAPFGYNVNFMDGTSKVSTLTQTVADGGVVDSSLNYTLDNKTGFAFKGWATSEGGDVVDLTTYTVTAETTFYAVWEAVTTYTVSFDLNGGVGEIAPITVNSGETISEPTAPTKEDGSAFVEWQLNGEKFDFSTPITSSIELVAEWAAPVYSESITINESGFTWAKDELDSTKTLTTTVDMKDGSVNTNPVVTWKSSDTTVVSVDNGVLTAEGKKGSATITALIYEGTEHEQSASINVTVGYTKLDAENRVYEYDFQNDSRALVEYTDTSKTGESENFGTAYNNEKFGIFTLKVAEGKEVKWFGTNKSSNPSIFMTGGTFQFTVDRAGTLEVTVAAGGNNRTLTLTETSDTQTVVKAGCTLSFNIPSAGTYNLEASANIYYKQMKFASKAESKWIDTDIHLGYQVGKSSADATKNDVVRFVGFINKDALHFLSHTWFNLALDGVKGENPVVTSFNTNENTTVYESIEYYDAEGSIQIFTPTAEFGTVNDFYYFTVTFYVAEDFTGSITATAYTQDIDGNTYQTSASASVNF